MLCFACGLYLGWAAGQMFGRGALLSLTSVLNATSDEPALTTGDTIQPHSLFDLLKPFQTPTPAFWTLTFVLLDFFFIISYPSFISSVSPPSLFPFWVRREIHIAPRRRLSIFSLAFVVMALGLATVRQAGDELVVDEGELLAWSPLFTPGSFRLCAFSLALRIIPGCWIVAFLVGSFFFS